MMLGEALRLIRVFHDRKLVDLAKELDISPGYLSEIERGKSNKKPSLELINRYAEVFNTKPSVILFFSEEIDKEKNRGPLKIKIRNQLLKFMKIFEYATS